MAISKAKRNRLYERDSGTCQYCGVIVDESDITLDHVVPISSGGSDSEDNLKVSCRSCNSSKGTRDIEYLRCHRRIQSSKYVDLVTVQQYAELVWLGVKFEELPEYKFHFEKVAP